MSTSSHSSSLACCVIVLCVATSLLLSAPVAAAAAVPYRCQRPFDSMVSFKPTHHRRAFNCDFSTFHVLDASSTVYYDGANATAGSTGDLKVKVGIQAETAESRLGDLRDVRYTLELLAPHRATSIKYEGFDHGQGYGLCDTFMVLGETQAQSQALCEQSAPSHKKNGMAMMWDGAIVRSVFRTDLVGEWEMRITFTRSKRSIAAGGGSSGSEEALSSTTSKDRVAIGKVVVPFTVRPPSASEVAATSPGSNDENSITALPS
eukprot:PhM_4_TR7271/c0_g1_i1/m.44256